MSCKTQAHVRLTTQLTIPLELLGQAQPQNKLHHEVCMPGVFAKAATNEHMLCWIAFSTQTSGSNSGESPQRLSIESQAPSL